MKLWTFLRQNVKLVLKDGSTISGFVQEYCNKDDNDEEIDSMGLSSPKFNISEMTDEELSHLRFTMFSKEDEEDIMAELKKRGLVL